LLLLLLLWLDEVVVVAPEGGKGVLKLVLLVLLGVRDCMEFCPDPMLIKFSLFLSRFPLSLLCATPHAIECGEYKVKER